MRQSPQYIVPLLLFLIVVLLGALVWLQFIQGRGDADGKPMLTWMADLPVEPEEMEPDESGDQDADDPAQRAEGRRKDGADNVERPAQVTSEPLRNPTEDQRKPDMIELERQDAARQAAIDAMLAQSAGVPHVGDPEGNPKADLNARVQWIVPPLDSLGWVTPSAVRSGGYYEGKAITAALLKKLGISADDEKKTSDLSLLIGKVELPELSAPEKALWSPLKGPPVVVTFAGMNFVANQEGWFAVLWVTRDADKSKLNLSATAPGMRMVDTREESPVDLRELRSDKGVTLVMERAPQVVFTVKYGPAQVTKCDAAAWLEIWAAEPSSHDRATPSPGLFITARVPKSGVLTFLFPDPRSWTSRPVRFGVGGDGWGLPSPRRLQLPDGPRAHRRADAEEEKVIRLGTQLALERAYTERVTGRCQRADGSAPTSFVRLEGSHTGVVTWTDSRAAFDVHLNYEKGNWRQDLKVETPAGARFEFGVSYDDKGQPFAALADGGSAPGGPWVITVPHENTAAGLTWLYYADSLSKRSRPPAEIWLRKQGALHALVVDPGIESYRRLWSIPDLVQAGDEVLLKFKDDSQYVPGVLRFDQLPETAVRQIEKKPSDKSEPSKEDSSGPKGWIVTAAE